MQLLLERQGVETVFDSWSTLSACHGIKGNLGQNLGFQGALSGQRQFLAIENPLKMMKNAFYFTLKPLFVLET